MKAIATKQPTNESVKQNKSGEKGRSYHSCSLSTGMPLLQRKCACGGGCPRCKEELGIQTKLKIGEPGDKYEQEADQIADEVMRMPEPSVQRQMETQEEEEEEEMVQRKAIASASSPVSEAQDESEVPSIVHEVLRSPGQPLDKNTRAFMEPRLGHDFSQVRIHTDSRAEQLAQSLNARAFTLRNNIVFNRGEYHPGSSTGQHLLAHELTHFLQQRQAIEPTIQKARVPATDLAQEHDESDSSHLTPDLSTPVQRIVISCTDNLIFFETFTSIYIYQLTECNVPIGSFATTVRKPYEINGKTFDIFWDLGSDVLSSQAFRFNYSIRPDQENPANLFDNGQNVTIDVVPSIDIPPTQEPSSGCRVRVPDEILIPQESIQEMLFELRRLSEDEGEIWTHTIPLGQFGWADVSLVASGSVTGELLGGYGPGVLRNICLIRRLDDNRLAGQAEFSIEGNIGPEITLEGSLSLEAEYLSIIPVGEIGGELSAVGRAGIEGGVNARFEVIYDHMNDEWSLVADSLIAGRAFLGFELNARAFVQLLSSEIWSEEWELINEEIGFDWQGGLRIGPGQQVNFITGQIGGEGVGIQSTSSESSSGSSGDEGAFTLPLKPILQALLEHDPENTQQTVSNLTGRTRQDPIPMIWYKPPNEYPRAVILYEDEVFEFGVQQQYTLPDPDVLTRGERGASYLKKYLDGGPTVTVGVDPALIPTQDKVNNLDESLVWKKVRSYRRALGQEVQRGFRFLMIAHGHDMRARNEDADHVKDLQFEGPDDFNNMWPLNSRINQSTWRFAEQEVTYTDEEGNPQRVQLNDPVLLNRYFRIVGFRLF